MTVESLSVLDLQVHYRQVISPNHQSGSFVGDDTDNHDFIFQGRGKSVLNFQLYNQTDQTLTWTLYGMHESDGTVGDAGTFEIDSDTVLTGARADEGFMGYSYPYYLLRLSFASTPDGSTVNVYINLTVGI